MDSEQHNFNRLIIDVKATNVKIGIYTKQQKNMKGRNVEHLPQDLQQRLQKKSDEMIWMSSVCTKEAIPYDLDLLKYPSLAAWWYADRAYHYLKGKTYLQKINFTKDWTYWVRKDNIAADHTAGFDKFTLQFRSHINEQNQSLVVYCYVIDSGHSTIFTRSVQELIDDTQLDSTMISSVVYNKSIVSIKHLSDEQRCETSKLYPLLNYKLAQKYNIVISHPLIKNRIKHFSQRIEKVKKDFLMCDEFKSVVPHNGVWDKATAINHIPQVVSNYKFNASQKNNNIQVGLKDYGPYKMPPKGHTHLFFIIAKGGKALHEKLENHVKKTAGYTPLENYSHLSTFYDKDLNLQLESNNNIVNEVKEHVKGIQQLADTNYFAIYISPYSKYDPNRAHHQIYYRVKELLLEKSIYSQTIDLQKGMADSLNYWMPNIASAMITKMGGIPWLLDKNKEQELIIGFGASKCKDDDELYIGSAFCFNQNGKFQEFDCWPASDSWALIGQLKVAIDNFHKHNNKIKRIIIHYYKDMNKNDFDQVDEMLENLNYSFPVIVVRINSSFHQSEIVINATKAHCLPQNGSYIKLYQHNYLLYINAYNEDNKTPTKGPFPLKIALQSNIAGLVGDPKLVEDLMQQLHDFSQLHWRSLAQPRLPVTLAYPQYLARLTPHFRSNVLMSSGKKSLWFL